ncbi:unnamed protein product [Sphagnum compactum]
MPGRRLFFSWRHSGLSCKKSQCTTAETADVLIDVADDADARSSSFSISSLASSSSTMQAVMQIMSSKTSRISRGCSSPAQSTTKQQQLHDDQPDHVNMIHGCNNIYSSKIAVMIKQQQEQQQQSCSTASSPGAAASCSSNNSNSNNSARKSTDHSYYIHQTQTGEYYYKAPAAAADHKVKRGNSKSLQAAGKIMITSAGGIFRTCRHADDLTTAATAGDNNNNNNMCLVRGCCECSSIMQQQQQQACSESWNSNSSSSSFQAYPAFEAEYHHVDAAAGTGSAAAASHNRSSSSSSAAPKCVCPKCGEAFSTAEVLELHKISHHAVSQLKNGNSSLNVLEIIFKTSWVQQQKQQQTKQDHESSTTAPATAAGPAPKIERILKIENKETAIHEFEEYRNKVKERNAPATAAAHDHHYTADQRCVADGNELLRFFATSLSCCLGDNGCTNLCSLPDCNRLQPEQYGMFVCRVIAGRIQKLASDQKLPALPAFSLLPQGYDSVAQEYCSSPGAAGSPSSSSSSSSSSTVSAHLDDLFVFDSKAVLPCFLVVYTI